MTERDRQIIEQLEKCAESKSALEEIVSQADKAESELERELSNEPEEQPWQYCEKNGKNLVLMCIFATIAIVCLVLTVMFAKQGISNWNSATAAKDLTGDYSGDPGEVYRDWLASWSNYNTFDELEEGWGAVQEDWESKGLSISWEFVKDVYEENPYPEAARFDYSLRRTISSSYARELKDKGTNRLMAAVLLGIAFVFVAVPAVVFTKIYFSVRSTNVFIKNQNIIAEKYNEGEYIKIHDAWLAKVEKMSQEYDKLLKAGIEETKILEEKLKNDEKQLYDTFNIERCRYSYSKVANIMKYDFVTYERALQKCQEDEQEDEREAARIREAEARRRAEEEHFEEMERYAREQARAAEAQARAAAAQARAIEERNREMEKEKIKQEAAAFGKCNQCANRARCSVDTRKNSLTCSGFTPNR